MRRAGRIVGMTVSLLLVAAGIALICCDRSGWSTPCFLVGGIGAAFFGPPPNDTTGFDGLPS